MTPTVYCTTIMNYIVVCLWCLETNRVWRQGLSTMWYISTGFNQWWGRGNSDWCRIPRILWVEGSTWLWSHSWKDLQLPMQSVPITTKVASSNLAQARWTLCDKVCQWLEKGLWFTLSTLVSSTNKTHRHDITEILLKVELNTKTLTPLHGDWLHRGTWRQSLIFFHKIYIDLA